MLNIYLPRFFQHNRLPWICRQRLLIVGVMAASVVTLPKQPLTTVELEENYEESEIVCVTEVLVAIELSRHLDLRIPLTKASQGQWNREARVFSLF